MVQNTNQWIYISWEILIKVDMQRTYGTLDIGKCRDLTQFCTVETDA